jgi:hypothetical protein
MVECEGHCSQCLLHSFPHNPPPPSLCRHISSLFLPPSHLSPLSAIISPQSFCSHLIPHISLPSYLPSLFTAISSLTSLCHHISLVFLPPSHPSHLSAIISLCPSYPCVHLQLSFLSVSSMH